ncbi:helix-turn-helix transcriptional regulator [Paenibacillus methanolicus]|uniref:AraC-like protein n=1 Tax=Paenibacillus methanolicus TaxID=582686 RepID=A0A5S5CAW7_9BACL|nr:AraC family transcriptional regulator [Paenibacillus methanolicus]TYP76551.1 AraC-like protein [Paenibacillus methanolicus]
MNDFHYENGAGMFGVSYRKAKSHHMPTSHLHGTYEVYCLMSGQREFFVQDRTIVMREGDIVIVAPHVLHRTTNAAMPEHERLIVNIHPSRAGMTEGSLPDVLLPLAERAYLVVRLPLHERISVDSLTGGIRQEIAERKPGFEHYAMTLTQQLLIRCCRHIGQEATEPPAPLSPMHERISEIVRYINDRYMEELSLQLVADRFYVSPYYLSRFFKEATGFTFVEYVNGVRIKEAKRLLEESALKVGAIAKKVGFGSVTHFGRVFKEATGYVPLHYRRGRPEP